MLERAGGATGEVGGGDEVHVVTDHAGVDDADGDAGTGDAVVPHAVDLDLVELPLQVSYRVGGEGGVGRLPGDCGVGVAVGGDGDVLGGGQVFGADLRHGRARVDHHHLELAAEQRAGAGCRRGGGDVADRGGEDGGRDQTSAKARSVGQHVS